MFRPRFLALLLSLVTLLLYLPVRRHEFIVYDDGDYITQNRIVQQGWTWAGVKWAFTTLHASNWHPLTWLSHMTDCELFGLDAGAHHLVNALLHTVNALLLFWLLLRLTGATWATVMVAALFAWHPLRVESVAWAAERKDVLAAFFGLASLLAYTRHAQGAGNKTRGKSWSYWLAWLLFACGLLAKPMLVTLPCVMLLLDWWPLGRVSGLGFRITDWRRRLVEKWPFFMLTVASCVVTFVSQRTTSVLTLTQLPGDTRLANAMLSYAKYLGKTVWPADLAIIYPLRLQWEWTPLLLTVFTLITLTSGAWVLRRRCPYLLMGWLWYLGMLVPVIGLVQVGRQALADRYTYLPQVGLLIAVVFGLRELCVRWRFKPIYSGTVAGLAMAACLFGTRKQLTCWQNDEKLFSHAIAVTHDNATAHINLGVALEQRGLNIEALAHYREAARIEPHSVEAHNDIANVLDELGQTEEALTHYREALRLNPKASLAHCNLGTALVKLGRFDEAWAEYTEAARLTPEDPRPYYLMGKTALKQGDRIAAIAHFRAAIRRDEFDIKALTYLARMLASDADARVRNGMEALSLASRANELTGEGQPLVLDVLAMALAETGRFFEAQTAANKAVAIAIAGGETNLAAEIQPRLLLYQAGQPWHEPPTRP